MAKYVVLFVFFISYLSILLDGLETLVEQSQTTHNNCIKKGKYTVIAEQIRRAGEKMKGRAGERTI